MVVAGDVGGPPQPVLQALRPRTQVGVAPPGVARALPHSALGARRDVGQPGRQGGSVLVQD